MSSTVTALANYCRSNRGQVLSQREIEEGIAEIMARHAEPEPWIPWTLAAAAEIRTKPWPLIFQLEGETRAATCDRHVAGIIQSHYAARPRPHFRPEKFPSTERELAELIQQAQDAAPAPNRENTTPNVTALLKRCRTMAIDQWHLCGVPSLREEARLLATDIEAVIWPGGDERKPDVMEPPTDLREQLAALCHEQWAGWMKYLFVKGNKKDKGSFEIFDDEVKRWERQMNTPYADLSHEEKESDRKEADKFLAVIADNRSAPAVSPQTIALIESMQEASKATAKSRLVFGPGTLPTQVKPKSAPDALRKALADAIELLEQVGPKPPNHWCGPESMCDQDCANWASFSGMLEDFRKVLRDEPEPEPEPRPDCEHTTPDALTSLCRLMIRPGKVPMQVLPTASGGVVLNYADCEYQIWDNGTVEQIVWNEAIMVSRIVVDLDAVEPAPDARALAGRIHDFIFDWDVDERRRGWSECDLTEIIENWLSERQVSLAALGAPGKEGEE